MLPATPALMLGQISLVLRFLHQALVESEIWTLLSGYAVANVGIAVCKVHSTWSNSPIYASIELVKPATAPEQHVYNDKPSLVFR